MLSENANINYQTGDKNEEKDRLWGGGGCRWEGGEGEVGWVRGRMRPMNIKTISHPGVSAYISYRNDYHPCRYHFSSRLDIISVVLAQI